MKRFKLLIASLTIALFGVIAITPVATVAAYDPFAVCDETGGSSDGEVKVCSDENKNKDGGDLIRMIINVLLYIIGAISVIMIIVAGVMYTTSSGDSGSVSKAKNTLTYAIVGLAVAFFAYAIVNWVLQLF